ncbi:hypothetical protein A9986_03685 [Solibacillus silvestris]|nr:hypothetical protein [Solibacillus silvestris]OBW60284.1 hypothetical protein A9986_03685 [Solibacillus silvestris]
MQKKIKIIEDSKSFILAIALSIFIWIFFSNYWHYPSPPFESLTSKEVIRILEEESSESGFLKIATENNFDWYTCKHNNCLEENVLFPLTDRGWHKQDITPYYKPNGKLIRIEYIYTKNQVDGNLGTTLKIEVYHWVDSEDINFLKIPQDINF